MQRGPKPRLLAMVTIICIPELVRGSRQVRLQLREQDHGEAGMTWLLYSLLLILRSCFTTDLHGGPTYDLHTPDCDRNGRKGRSAGPCQRPNQQGLSSSLVTTEVQRVQVAIA